MNLAVIALPGAEAPAARIAAAAGRPLLRLAHRRFPDEELYLRVDDDVQGLAVAIVADLQRPDARLFGLRLLADTLRDLGAARVGLIAPYLPYLRQDTRFQPGEAVSSRSLGRFLSQTVDWLATVDPHLHRHASLGEVMRIPSAVVPAAPRIADWLRREVAHPVVVGPDEESGQWVAEVARRAGCPARVMRKERRGDRSVRVSPPPLDGLAGRTPVLLDDIVSSGHTLAEAARALVDAGLPAPVAVVVHGLLAPGAAALLGEAGLARLALCDTVPTAGGEIDVLPDLAEAALDWVQRA